MKRAVSPTPSSPKHKKLKIDQSKDESKEESKDESKKCQELFEKAVALEKNDMKAAFDIYQQASSLNHLRSKLRVAICYMEGTGTPKDCKTAKEIFEDLSFKQDMHVAHNNLGVCYHNGLGTAVNYEKAFQLFEKAAAQEVPLGVFNLARSYALGTGVQKDQAKAFELYQKAVQLGSCGAMSNLALFYEKGIVVPKDLSKALELTKRAAEGGHSVAQYNLSQYYEKEKDWDSALLWLQKSADQNYEIAIHDLAYSYKNGTHGLQKDINKSIELWKKSANLGLPESVFNLAVFYRDGVDVPKDLAKAFEMFLQSATMSLPCLQATEEVAFCYFYGKGVAQNYEKAFEWFSKGVSLGFPACLNGLGFMYEKGFHVAENKPKAFELFSKAASTNDPLAVFNLGVCYEQGSGTSKDEAKAFEHFQTAYQLGEEVNAGLCTKISSLALGRCYEKGVGTKRDLLEALKWHRLSQNNEEVFKMLSNYKSEVCEQLLSIPLLRFENEKLKQEIEELQARPGGETFWKAKEEFEKFVLK